MTVADQRDDLLGRVWDTWGSLTPRQKRRIDRRHRLLADALYDIERHVNNELRTGWVEIKKAGKS